MKKNLTSRGIRSIIGVMLYLVKSQRVKQKNQHQHRLEIILEGYGNGQNSHCG